MDKHEELVQRGYVADACDAIRIIFVYKPADLLSGANCHRPSMAHQIFAEEAIYGYRGLLVYIYYLAHSGHCYFRVQYDKCCKENGKPFPGNDDIFELLKPWFPSYTVSLHEIRDLLAREQRHKIYGTIVNSFVPRTALMNTNSYQITLCSIKEHGFISFHKRFQSLIIMYIDAANFITLTDEKWMIFYLYHQCPTENAKLANYPIGFCTVYKFLKYPDKIRARISQFFIIPPFQRMGLGYKFLNTIYDVLKSMSEIEEITVESPNEVFTRLRDNLDLSRVIKLSEFCADRVINGYSKAMREAVFTKFKLSKRQSKRLYHILRYYVLQAKYSDEDFEAYKSDVMADLERCLKKSCVRNYYKLPPVESVSDKERYLEDQFCIFLKEMQSSIAHLRLHCGGA